MGALEGNTTAEFVSRKEFKNTGQPKEVQDRVQGRKARGGKAEIGNSFIAQNTDWSAKNPATTISTVLIPNFVGTFAAFGVRFQTSESAPPPPTLSSA